MTIGDFSPTAKFTLFAVVIALFVGAFSVLDLPHPAEIRHAAGRYRELPAGAILLPVGFGAIYCFACLFPLPRTIFTVSSGILFGPLLGFGVSLTAASAAAVIAFLSVRRLGAATGVNTAYLSHPAVRRANARLEARGWLAIGALRLVPVVPFSALNYLSAVTPVRLLPYTVATVVGSIPSTALGVALGDVTTQDAGVWPLLVLGGCGVVGVAALAWDATARVTGAEESLHREAAAAAHSPTTSDEEA